MLNFTDLLAESLWNNMWQQQIKQKLEYVKKVADLDVHETPLDIWHQQGLRDYWEWICGGTRRRNITCSRNGSSISVAGNCRCQMRERVQFGNVADIMVKCIHNLVLMTTEEAVNWAQPPPPLLHVSGCNLAYCKINRTDMQLWAIERRWYVIINNRSIYVCRYILQSRVKGDKTMQIRIRSFT